MLHSGTGQCQTIGPGVRHDKIPDTQEPYYQVDPGRSGQSGECGRQYVPPEKIVRGCF